MGKPQIEMLAATDLPKAALEARRAAGLTQAEASERLGVNQSNVSKAENDTTGRYVNLQTRMITELAGWKVTGPLWQLERTPDNGE